MNTETHIKNHPSRRKKRRKRLASRIVFIVALIMLLISGFQLARIFIGYHRADASYNDIRTQCLTEGTDEISDAFELDVDAFLALHEQYPEFVGWLDIPGTDISYPLMYRPGTDGNSFYLNHDYTGSSSVNGSIFIDTGNDMYLNDAHTVIYGHHMKSGAMFAHLLDYREEYFAFDHNRVHVWIIDEFNENVLFHDYQVISSHATLPDSSVYNLYFDEEPDSDEMTNFVNSLVENSDHEYEVPEENGSIITLSTCIGDADRYVLHCMMVYEEACR